MGVVLVDLEKDDKDLSLNFWNWHPIVEAILRLGVLPAARVKALHEPYIGSGLTAEEAATVAAALKSRLLPTLRDDERLLLDGSKTRTPDDGVMHHDEPKKNYSADAAVLRKFIEFCGSCKGFKVR